jgi:hypothetical protein
MRTLGTPVAMVVDNKRKKPMEGRKIQLKENNMSIKRRSNQIAVALTLNLILISVANAGTVGAVVDPISALSNEQFFTDVSGTTADAGATAVTIASGVIDNNYQNGWNITVASGNSGKLIRNAAANSDGATSADEILYTNIIWAKTGGVLGVGLTDPDASTEDITGGSATFETGAIATPATTATVAYAYNLNITWGADTTLLQGTYEDTITMTLAVNTD